MWWLLWAIPLTVLLALLVWILVAPIIITMHTAAGELSFRMKGLFATRMEIADEALELRIRIMGIAKTIRIFPSEVSPNPKNLNQNQQGGRSPDFRLADGMRLLRTFRVRKAELDIDTGSPIANGLMIPIGFALTDAPLVVRVNFTGENELWLVLENRLYRIAGFVLRVAFRRKRQ